MKASEIREMTVEEMENKLLDLKHELFNLRFQHASGQLENPKKLGQTRKEVARVKTIIRETQFKEEENQLKEKEE